jgi:hypothetical protein
MRTGLVLVCVAFVLGAAACGGSGTETTVRTPGAGTGESANTGIADLDYTLNATLRVDRIELAGLTGYQRIGCVEGSEGAASPPVCRENESPGQAVEGFPVLQCELVWLRPEVMADTYGQALGSAPHLVAVYRPVERPMVLDADYIAVFDTNPDESVQAGVALAVKEGRIIQVEYACTNFADLYALDKVQEFVVEPPAAEATPG